MPVLGFEVVRRAKYDEATINHDGDLVTELLSLVHAMRCQQDGSHLHLLDHAVKRAS